MYYRWFQTFTRSIYNISLFYQRDLHRAAIVLIGVRIIRENATKAGATMIKAGAGKQNGLIALCHSLQVDLT